MTETGDALRATSDGLMRDLDVLSALEEEKRTLVPGDPRLVDLATQIEEIAGRILGQSARQRELSEELHDLANAGTGASPGVAIDETPRSIATVLAEWRDAERRLAAAEPGSAEAAEAGLHVDRLRAEYRRAHDETRRHQR